MTVPRTGIHGTPRLRGDQENLEHGRLSLWEIVSSSRGESRRLEAGKGRNDLSDKHSMIKLLSGLFNSPYCPQES